MSDEQQYCQNCSAELHGEFCSNCGQRNKNFHVPIKELAHEFSDEFLSFDDRLLRSLKPFLLKPGFLTLEYLSGKRKQYISPFKLYFFISFLFFFLIALNDPDTTYVRSGNIVTNDSVKISSGMDTIYALVNGKKSGFKFTIADSVKSQKMFGRGFSSGLRKMKDNPQLFFDKMKEYRPKIIFVLLPVFALLLKMLYFRSKVLYVRHLVFAFYFHAFVFFILFFIDLLDLTGVEFLDSYSGVLLLAIPANLYFGMKRVYQQSSGKTLIKLSLLITSYTVTFFFAFFIAMFIFISVLYT